VVNNSDEPNSLEICFHGIRIISSMAQSGRDSFAEPQRRQNYRGNSQYRQG